MVKEETGLVAMAFFSLSTLFSLCLTLYSAYVLNDVEVMLFIFIVGGLNYP